MFWRDAVGNRWVEIDADAIKHNLNQVRSLLEPDIKIIGVVKANAYGLGAIEVARILLTYGVCMVAVTTVEEAIELREGGITSTILILSPFLPGEVELITKYNLTPSVSNIEQVEVLAKQVKIRGFLSVHVKIETGMGRTGLLPEDVRDFFAHILKYPEVYVEGIFSHLAQAKKGDEYTYKQFEIFQEALNIVEELGFEIPCRHICNSAATLDLPEMHLNTVRIGTILYGQHPAHTKNKLSLKDPWQLKTKVINVREIKIGESVGYGREYIAQKNTRVAVIPLGWADGLTVSPIIRPKNLKDLLKMFAKLFLDYIGKSKTSTVNIEKKSYRFIGRLGMQLSMIEIDDIVNVGDVVLLKIRRLSTNSRIPRVYFASEDPYQISMPAGLYSVQKDEINFECKERSSN